jgi:hypothetical protein
MPSDLHHNDDLQDARQMRETAKRFASAFAPSSPATGAEPDTALAEISSDPSYLPQLRSCLQQLLADRERVLAATDLQDWAKDRAAPREEEISQLRDLIRRIEADLHDLTDQDQAMIAEAVSVIRKTRQVVNFGIPAVRPAAG